jgi:hypothetical protein
LNCSGFSKLTGWQVVNEFSLYKSKSVIFGKRYITFEISYMISTFSVKPLTFFEVVKEGRILKEIKPDEPQLLVFFVGAKLIPGFG